MTKAKKKPARAHAAHAPRQASAKSEHPAAKLASTMANKAAKNTFSAMSSTRNSAENAFKMGGSAVKDMISSSASEARKAQEKAFAMGRQHAEKVAQSADKISKVMSEAIGLSRDNVEAAMECGNMTANLAKDISSEHFDAANQAFADNLEISKEFFACRTINDMMELQNRIMKNAIDNMFNQSVKLSNRLFEFSTEALEPINERVSEASDKISKALAA